MEHSTSELTAHFSLLSWASLLCAVIAAAILVWFLIARPSLGRATKFILLLGFGIFPIGSALTANLVGYERTMERGFCGSCHTMGPYAADSNNPESTTLAARHARNSEFGDRNCYVCHADYGMFGTVSTKLAGMRHVWEYYSEYRSVPLEESLAKVRLLRDYPNANCMHCHSTEIPGWNEIDEHTAAAGRIRNGEISCVSAGCHGPAHPFSKSADEVGEEVAP